MTCGSTSPWNNFAKPSFCLCSHQSKALESKATGRKKRRKMRKKKERPKALSALEKKSRDDSEVLAAVKQVREAVLFVRYMESAY